MYPVIGRGWPETLSIRFISALFSPLLSLLLAFKWKRVYPFASFIFIISSPTCSLDIWCRQKQKKNPPTLGGEKKLYSRRHKIKMSDSKTPPRIHHAANCAFSLIKHFFFFFSIDKRRLKTFKTNERPFPLSQSMPHASGSRDIFMHFTLRVAELFRREWKREIW